MRESQAKPLKPEDSLKVALKKASKPLEGLKIKMLLSPL